MRVTINGQERELAPGTTLAQAVAALGLSGVPLVAEVDGAIVPREEWAACVLQPGARVELVRFVGGG